MPDALDASPYDALLLLSFGGPEGPDDVMPFLADESPPHGTRGPAAAGFTTVRVELFVDDPRVVHARALTAGAREHSPVREHAHSTEGPRPIRRMLQGAVIDPFGHLWLIGKILE